MGNLSYAIFLVEKKFVCWLILVEKYFGRIRAKKRYLLVAHGRNEVLFINRIRMDITFSVDQK